MLALIGYMLPARIVTGRQQAWQCRIEAGIADALDFLLVCVEAGQSVDLATTRVASELADVHPDLAERFSVLSQELAAGASRQDAFDALAESCQSDDLRQFGTIVLQSGTLGTPIAQTLRIFAEDLRDRRIRRVEEKAAILPTKMTLGTMIFTLPPLLILLLAPAIYKILSTI